MRYHTIAVSPEGRIHLTIRTLTPFLDAEELDYSAAELPVVMGVMEQELTKDIEQIGLPRIEPMLPEDLSPGLTCSEDEPGDADL